MDNLCEAFQATAARNPDAVALRSHDGALEITWREYAAQVRSLATGLAALGVGPGDTVALMLTNRPEFGICDTAVLHLGATPFSVYNTSSPEQIKHLFSNAENRVAICEEQFAAQLAAGAQGTVLEHVICIDGTPEGALAIADVAAMTADGFDFERRWQAVGAEDIATLIYTSGTTGPPKGVELTHANLIAQVEMTDETLGFSAEDRSISYLPLAHMADRWITQYVHLVVGHTVTFLPDVRQIAALLPSVRPTVWGAVPRIWEKMRAELQAAGVTDPSVLPEPARLALLERMGLDRLRWAVSGAAPIPTEVLEYFLALGVPILELWGMSELSCCATINPLGDVRVGTVGIALPGLELRLDEDGELLVRGATVMRGYRRDPAKTAEALDPDGWLRTGDIATIDEDGFVRIVDRKKELIINAAGKNMSPANIEQVVKASSALIGQAVCIGDARPFNVALIVADPDVLAGRAIDDPEVVAEIGAGIARANERLSRVEQIKRYHVLAVDWLPGGDELTPTMKLKRKPIGNKYATEIEALYAPEPAALR